MLKRNDAVLYSFRRCPYAIRTRMVIAYSQIQLEIREVVLKDKPKDMLVASPKGTVPVLVIESANKREVIDESLDIMKWALAQNDPKTIVTKEDEFTTHPLIQENDNEFKQHLDKYKYADRFPSHPVEEYRARGEVFLAKLNKQLEASRYLTGRKLSVLDIAIFPFIRQFAFVDKAWFDQSRYTRLESWLNEFLTSPLFLSTMEKLPQWQSGQPPSFFPRPS